MQRLLLNDLLKATGAMATPMQEWEVPYAIEEIRESFPESETAPVFKCYEQPTLWQWVKLYILGRSPWR